MELLCISRHFLVNPNQTINRNCFIEYMASLDAKCWNVRNQQVAEKQSPSDPKTTLRTWVEHRAEDSMFFHWRRLEFCLSWYRNWVIESMCIEHFGFIELSKHFPSSKRCHSIAFVLEPSASDMTRKREQWSEMSWRFTFPHSLFLTFEAFTFSTDRRRVLV